MFAVMLDEIAIRIHEEVSWGKPLLNANNIILVDETNDEIISKLGMWRKAPKSN